MNQHPVIPIHLDRSTRILDAIAFVGLVISLAIAVSNWSSLPDTIPIHFGITGQADGWGNKLFFWVFPLLNLAIVIGFTVMRRYPQTFNYPVRITPQNAEVQYEIAINLLNWFKAEFAWLFVWLEWQIINVAKGSDSTLDSAISLIFICSILGTTGFSIYRAWQNR